MSVRANDAAASSAVEIAFFEKQIRPLLIEHCQKCHGVDDAKGGLRVTSRAALLQGGDSGPALVPGKPEESLLLGAVRYESYEMPPTGRLPDRDIAALTRWIELGAPWPGGDADVAIARASKEFTEEDRAWWPIQPLSPQPPPRVQRSEWPVNGIDHFILSALETQGLAPAPEADRVRLIRRLSFDLTGLPPRPDDVRSFLDDTSADAYERLVDRFLDSEEYGERWARHWLDLVRYADSDGYRIDGYRPHAWRYRDYVIDALNADKPYARFVQEQLAGDELFPGDPAALVATGYLRHGIYEYNNLDVRGQWEVMQNELTDTTADVFLGLGLQCARCHDHKFDPLLQQDYFRLRAFFEALSPRDEVNIAAPEQRAAYEEQWRRYSLQAQPLLEAIEEIEAVYRRRGEVGKIKRFPEDIQELIRRPASERAPEEQQLVDLAWRQVIFEYNRIDQKMSGDAKERLLELRRQLARHDDARPAALPLAMTATDVGPVAPPTMIPKKRIETLPGLPSLLDPAPLTIESLPTTTGRRAALARWITAPENSLTSRVIVNRIWQYHFGRGLAPHSSDFGRLGGAPSHPELLDWLTAEFLKNEGRWKPLHRLIVTSATYRQSTTHPQFLAYQTLDPENKWYWRANTRRLDAEQIRDALLVMTGQLDPLRGGEGVTSDIPRRSIYLRVMRNARDPLLDAFDLPQFFSSASSRDTTTTPIQSLLLMNSSLLLRSARELAERTRPPQRGKDATQFDSRVRSLWELVFSRPPSPAEMHEALNFLQEQQQRDPREARASTLANVATGKVPYRDGQALMVDISDRAAPELAVAHAAELDVEDFTIEAFFQLRSVADTAAVRTLAAKWDPAGGGRGWQFGVTGQGSRRKPQTLVLLIMGQDSRGRRFEAPLFSDQHVEINKPYYAGVSFSLAANGAGVARFYIKDLSNDDEPLLMAEIPHQVAGGFSTESPLTLGSRRADSHFDGLIDDVRLSAEALAQAELLTTVEGSARRTIGYWQFESMPGIEKNSVSSELHLQTRAARQKPTNTVEEAFVDLCHVLLNANEFLYVD